MDEAEFIRHDPCEECGSSDGKAIYSDGHSFCFVCRTWKHGDETPPMSQQPTTRLQGFAQRLSKRNISEETCEKLKIYRDGDLLRFHYFTKDGVLRGAKVKTKNKVFTYEGENPGTLWMEHLWPDKGKRIVITEGEIDAASVFEVFPTWPVVSIPSGAAGYKKPIQMAIPKLQGYEEIVIFFDGDQAGREAAEGAASLLPPGKVKIARMEAFKDASEALIAGEREILKKAIWDAKPYRPDGIVEGQNLFSVVTAPNPPNDYDYPFSGLQKKLHGIRLGELTTITAGSGSGKSSVCRDLAAYLLNKGESVGYLALEESVRRTALGLMSASVGKALHLGEHSHAELSEAYDLTMKDWKLFLFDGFGSYDPDVIYNRIEYLATGLDCKVIFLDHLSILLSGLDGDERRMIDTTMTRLRSLVERTGIALFLVSHLKRGSTDAGHEEGQRVSLSQLRGSAAIGQLSDSVIALERDQQSDNQDSTTTVRILKNRYSGETGIASYLKYDLETCKFLETTNETEEFDPATDF
jgi:twinkle protein